METAFFFLISNDTLYSRGYFQGRNRHILLRGQSDFSWFFPGVKCFFPVENSHFGRPKTNFRRFQKWKAKKKKKKEKVVTTFYHFSYFHFQFSFFSSQFSPLFPFFLASFFPKRHLKFPGQQSLGGTLPPGPPPRLLRHWVFLPAASSYLRANAHMTTALINLCPRGDRMLLPGIVHGRIKGKPFIGRIHTEVLWVIRR